MSVAPLPNPQTTRPGEGEHMSSATLSPVDELERARVEYLAVSRSGHLYASEAEHLRLEGQAWERLERALEVLRDADPAEHQPY